MCYCRACGGVYVLLQGLWRKFVGEMFFIDVYPPCPAWKSSSLSDVLHSVAAHCPRPIYNSQWQQPELSASWEFYPTYIPPDFYPPGPSKPHGPWPNLRPASCQPWLKRPQRLWPFESFAKSFTANHMPWIFFNFGKSQLLHFQTATTKPVSLLTGHTL